MPIFGFNPVIVMPTFNNARTLGLVIGQALQSGLAVIVVDDGCTDITNEVLGEFDGKISVIRHPQNRGKAAALRTGFAAAHQAGFTHVVVVDTDGQLNPLQIPQFISRANEDPEALILGVRDDRKEDYPSGSRTGRRVSNLLVRIESGLKVSDSQCGFRVYPLGFIAAVKCPAARFGFETEILTRAGWAGCKIVEITVSCTYSPAGGRVSHFRPWRDSFRAVAMHARLLVRAFLPWPHTKWPVENSKPNENWLQWLNPRRAWREMREEQTGRWRMALSIAVGVWIAHWPVYPCQTLAALYTSRRLHLNPLATILGSQASTPPMNFVLIAASITVGHFLLHGAAPPVSWHQIYSAELWRYAGTFAVDWLVGGVLMGFIVGAIVFGILLAAFACIPLKSDEQITAELAVPPVLSHPSRGG